jgi:Fe-S cluster assembly iron-binding protein IscA
MKKYLFLFLVSVYSFGQSVADPRLIVSRTAPITLTTAWQEVFYTGVEAGKTLNTFGKDPVTNKLVFDYNSTTNLLTYNEFYPHNFNLFFEFRTTSTIISTKATLQLRFAIPNGISPGVDLNFPFENQGGYIDVYDVSLFNFAVNNKPFVLPLYIGNALKANGFKIYVKLSTATVGGTTIDYTSLSIQGIARN